MKEKPVGHGRDLKSRKPDVSRRDYFAGQALAGILANSALEKLRQDVLDNLVSEDKQTKGLVKTCIYYADAMIKELRK